MDIWKTEKTIKENTNKIEEYSFVINQLKDEIELKNNENERVNSKLTQANIQIVKKI